MSNVLMTHIQLINDKVKFHCNVPGKEPITVDYIPPLGDGEGYTSLELLLISISTCLGSTTKLMIENHLKKKVHSLQISTQGERRDQHPTSFKKIVLDYEIVCPELQEEELKQIITMAKDQYAPVLDMIKNHSEIEIHIKIAV